MTTRKQYKIADLLSNSVQPFDDLDAETLAAIDRGMETAASLVVPIVITSDGVLVDGHQRLKLLQGRGRTVISGEDVRVVPATKEEALEWSIRLNVQRRHLTTEQKATMALEIRNKKRWSNNKIADLFGVSGAAVGQWLKGEEKLDAVVGKDGVMQPPKATKQAASERMVRADVHPWQGDGPTLRTVVRLTRDLEAMIPDPQGAPPIPGQQLPRRSELGDNQFDFVKLGLEELGKAVSAVLAEMAKPEPAPTPTKKAAPSKRAARPHAQ